MACNISNYCNAYGTGVGGAGYRAACATNAQISTANFVSGHTINASDVSNLRSNILTQMAAFNTFQADNGGSQYTVVDPGAASSGQSINHSYINDLSTTMSGISNAGISTSTGQAITSANWTAIVNAYNIVAADCICNSNCPCNNVCSCYGDCVCNYSDERLKEQIEFVGVKEGLNVYSWCYVWDNQTRYEGIIAQELIGTVYDHAVKTDSNGYYYVNYDALPISMKVI
jgi:hypothetical protein